MLGGRTSLAAALCVLALCALPGTSGAADGPEATCAAASAALDRGQLAQARAGFSDVLAADPGSTCAVRGLNATTAAERSEQRHCETGAALAKAGDEPAAREEYVAALSTNVASTCGAKGLAGLDDEGGWQAAGEVVEYLPKVSEALIAVLVFLAAGVGIVGVGLLIRAALRGRKASLVLKPFGDGGGDPALGSAMTALVEERLIAIGHRGRAASDRLSLDFVVADVELLGSEDELSTAFADVAAIPNLEFVAGLAAMLERLGSWRRIVVTGELLPPGSDGSGLTVAVARRSRPRRRETLWGGVPERGQTEVAAPYYALAEPAAAWVQYAVASELDGRVAIITSSAESFARFGAALQLHRAGQLAEAEAGYRSALELDADNVAALVNLANLQAPTPVTANVTIGWLDQAMAALVRRHRVAEESV